MRKNKIINFIMNNGSPAQRYVVNRDVLGADKMSPEMLDLQRQILRQKEVIKILKMQDENGWFGKELHGGFDHITGILNDYGVESYHPFMQKAKQALLLDKDPYPRNHPPVETYNYANYPRIKVLACLYNNDEHDKLLLKFQDEIIKKLSAVRNIDLLDEISKELTSKRFRETKGWKWHPDTEARGYKKDRVNSFPCISDIHILAKCLNWKDGRTENIVTEAMLHVSSFAPVPQIHIPVNGHWVGPYGSYEMLDHPFDCPHTQAQTGWRLNDYYCLCKVCDVEQIPHYYKNVEWLAERVQNDLLPEKWINETQTKTDIYFIVLLILHYAKIDF